MPIALDFLIGKLESQSALELAAEQRPSRIKNYSSSSEIRRTATERNRSFIFLL